MCGGMDGCVDVLWRRARLGPSSRINLETISDRADIAQLEADLTDPEHEAPHLVHEPARQPHNTQFYLKAANTAVGYVVYQQMAKSSR